MKRLSTVLEKIEENGIPAFLENNIKTAKKMRDKIKEVTKLELKSKL
jgi:Na+-translocating ferredoxin:NAD+ oxidoreductase RnfC subunit